MEEIGIDGRLSGYASGRLRGRCSRCADRGLRRCGRPFSTLTHATPINTTRSRTAAPTLASANGASGCQQQEDPDAAGRIEVMRSHAIV